MLNRNPDRRRRPIVLALVSAVVLGGCASSPEVRPSDDRATSTSTSPPAASTTTTTPVFSGVVAPVTAADLPSSWRPGCPVGPEDLRLLRMTYVGFDDQAHLGAMVVHVSVTEEVLGIFRRLYERRFPIRRMEPVDVYGGSDEASIAADNTSAFNCRNAVAIGPPTLSAHAFGKAVDVNPVENPYVLGGRVLPPSGAEYVDRSDVRPGMAVRGGDLTAAFAAAGWSWGGAWASPDYQHFSKTGN